jgi:anti-sigma-K factor RskA
MKLTQTELDWLAFRYVAGELPASEAESFESLLADEQTARDAVVHAVELSQTILAAEVSLASENEKIGLLSVSPAAETGRAWSTQLSWLASGVAAALLVALALNSGAAPQARPPVSPELARAWLKQTQSDETVFENVPSVESEMVTADIPDWMVDAVRSLHDKSDANDEDASSETMES